MELELIMGELHVHSFVSFKTGKSMCISEGHGGAGLACGPASAHCILSSYVFQPKFFLGQIYLTKGHPFIYDIIHNPLKRTKVSLNFEFLV